MQRERRGKQRNEHQESLTLLLHKKLHYLLINSCFTVMLMTLAQTLIAFHRIVFRVKALSCISYDTLEINKRITKQIILLPSTPVPEIDSKGSKFSHDGIHDGVINKKGIRFFLIIIKIPASRDFEKKGTTF